MEMDDEEEVNGGLAAPMFGASSTQPTEETDSHFQSFETLCKLRIVSFTENRYFIPVAKLSGKGNVV